MANPNEQTYIIPPFLEKYEEERDKRFDSEFRRIEEGIAINGERISINGKRIDDLHSDMNVQFEKVDKQFEKIDKRFEKTDKRFEKTDKQFENLRAEIKFDNDKLRTLIFTSFGCLAVLITILKFLFK